MVEQPEEQWRTEEGSFRDPAGSVIRSGNRIRRVISPEYQRDYDILMSSGLYGELTERQLMVPHAEIENNLLEPEVVPFISYPYEWPFEHLKKAALTTLDIASIALEHGMMLKDASAFNIQWHNGRCRLIDTLSFIKHEDDAPWIAYSQFLRHFFYPLLLRKYHIPYPYWNHIDGVTAQDAAKLLPAGLRFSFSTGPHIYALAQAERKSRGASGRPVRIPTQILSAFISHLRSTIARMSYTPDRGWTNYQSCSYSEENRQSKEQVVTQMLGETARTRMIDLGANTGYYTKLSRKLGFEAIALDSDHDCANAIGPLSIWSDICNPTPYLGWSGKERKGLLTRLAEYNKDGTVLALALIHHICVGNNVPIHKAIELLATLGKHLIIEFVAPEDPMVERIGRNRVFPEYNKGVFDYEIRRHYDVLSVTLLGMSHRIIYLARRMK